jgi:putative ABC transport system permease protein
MSGGPARDIRYALRLLRKNPGFTLAIVLTLGLGIGAVTTVFTLVDAVILRPLPVPGPDELVYLRDPSFSYPIFEQVRTRGHMFSAVFARDLRRMHVDFGGGSEPIDTLVVSGDYYQTLRVQPMLGRAISRLDEGEGGGSPAPVAVLSYRCWQRRFSSDPSVVGRTIRIERTAFTVIGVEPREFFGVIVGMAPEVTIPIAMLPALRPEDKDVLLRRSNAWLHIMGRLKPGVGIRDADAAFQVIWPHVLEATVDQDQPRDMQERFLSRRAGLVPGRTGFSAVRNKFSEPLWLLFGFVGVLLLVACATVANLVLARTALRQRELAVRLAIGAGRGRLVRQLFTEGLVLALLGAVAGLFLSVWAGDLLVSLLWTSEEPIVLDLPLDWRFLAFTTLLVGATTLLFTIAPALRAIRIDPGHTLKLSVLAVGTRHHGWRLGRALVVSQIALALTLLVAAALFVRSLGGLLMLDPGFDRSNLLVVAVDPVGSGYGGEKLTSYYQDLLTRLRGVPGVEAASLSFAPPISADTANWTGSIGIDGAPPRQDPVARTFFNPVSPGYFSTVGMSRLAGRDFEWSDSTTTPRVAIVNESLARTYFPNGDALGHRITVGRAAARRDLEIVGIVGDAKYQTLQEPTRRIAYFPYLQHPEFIEGSNLFAEVRTSIEPSGLSEAVRKEVRALDAGVPVRIEPVSTRVYESLVRERLIAMISSFLGMFALLLACAGLYGLMAHIVSHRTHEVGIRMALGADARMVLLMIARETLWLAVAGVAIGLGLSLAIGRVAAALLHGVTPRDPIAFAAAAGLMTAVAIGAGWVPARHAASVNPATALRQE